MEVRALAWTHLVECGQLDLERVALGGDGGGGVDVAGDGVDGDGGGGDDGVEGVGEGGGVATAAAAAAAAARRRSRLPRRRRPRLAAARLPPPKQLELSAALPGGRLLEDLHDEVLPDPGQGWGEGWVGGLLPARGEVLPVQLRERECGVAVVL